MAEDIGVNIVSKIVEKLGSAAFKKIKFVRDLKSHIERLRQIKSIIAAELQRLDPFEASTDLEGYKIKRIRCVHDELVQLFEEQETRAKQKEVVGGSTITAQARLFLSSSNQLVLPFRIVEKVNAITKELNSIASDYAQCSGILTHSSGNQNRCTLLSEETSPFPDASVLIGRDTNKENIVKMICNSSNDHVVAIVGVGGQGKTTLAQHVCQDDRVKSSFDKRLWVSLTPKSTVNEMFEKIIASATNDKSNYCSLEQLHLQVFEAISGKCLLVLDNVYYSENLRDNSEALSSKLEQGCFWRNGGKVLITSRSEKVAKHMHTPEPYKLCELAEDDCWRLLRHYAIKHEEEKKECGVEEIGKEIARMCPKMPLVLKTIGCYLADRDYKSQWEHFRNELASNPTLYIEQQDKIKQILKLCYDQLDYNLKLCVAFCSQFPKGHVYHRNDMVRYWIALGLVESRGGISLQDVGDAYVLELTQRAFFEEASNFNVFKMHDVMHDLMVLIGKDKHQMIDSKTKSIVEGVRHVCLNMQDLNWDILLSSISGIQTLQSILLVSSRWGDFVNGMPLRSGIKKLLSACPKLKVLEIYNQEIVKVPRSIGELTLVTHLNMSGNLFCKLPNEITKMVNLLTLDLSWCCNLQELPTEMGKLLNLSSLNLSWCRNLEELPRDMGKLVKLRHLRVDGCRRLRCMPEGFGNLRELETLDEFVVGESSKGKGGAKLEELGHLNNLNGRLRIRVAGESKYIVSEAGNAHLEKKTKLTCLEIRFENKAEEDEKFLEDIQNFGENWKGVCISNYGGKKLPSWVTNDQFHKRVPKLYSFVFGRNLTYIIFGNDDEGESMRFRVEGNEDDLGEWVPRYSRIKKHLKIGLIELAFRTRRRDGLTLTHVTEDVTLEDVRLTIKKELANRCGGGCGGQRQPNFLLKSCFPNLTVLILHDIPELEVLPEEFRDLTSLKSLYIQSCSKLKAIPDWIDTLSSLETIQISRAPEVRELPDSIGSLTSLKRLYLFDFTGLEFLPHQISNLSKSCSLQVHHCSKALYEKCLKPTGEYWPHLKHLKAVHITSSEGDRSHIGEL